MSWCEGWRVRLACWLFGHRFVLEHRCTMALEQVMCRRCDREYGYFHGPDTFLPWEDDFCVCWAIEQSMQVETIMRRNIAPG